MDPSSSGARPAIEVARASKIYRRFTHRKQFATLKSALLTRSLIKNLRADETFTALNDVSLTVPKGRTLGVIGRNGSGKSTLLKLVAGITKPSTGTVRVDGRVSALIELGAGFHPEISGRENVFINGIMLGLTKREVARRFDEIVEFAELENFIDAPVKTYSSGMYMRLAFSVAAHVDPDVLLIDEILAVGDEYFQRKCYAKLNEFRAAKKTICFVSHDLAAVERLCRRGLLLYKGEARVDGDIKRVLEAYHELVEAQEDHALAGAAPKGDRWGSGEIKIDAVTLHAGGDETHVVHSGAPFEIRLGYSSVDERDAVFDITLYRDDGMSVYGTNTKNDQTPIRVKRAGHVSFCVDNLSLLPGRYELDVAVTSPELHAYDYHSKRYTFRVTGAPGEVGTARIDHRWEAS